MIAFNELSSVKTPINQPIKDWIESAIINENLKIGDINYIFCDDAYLLEKNIKYLKHNTLTDIISFDYTMGKIISGDIFISVERVEENASSYQVSFKDELHRVMIHGVLHYCGYNDKTAAEKVQMRAKEDYYLSLRDF
jgi:probable rRNA maturation factor